MSNFVPSLPTSSEPLRTDAPLTKVNSTEQPSPQASPGLTQDVIFDRLQEAPPQLVKEINDLVVRQMATETGRQQRLDAKATSLLGAVGLTLTVLSTFGVQLVTSLAPAAQLHPKLTMALGAAALIATGLGLLAAVCAVRALGIRSFDGVAEGAIFSRDAIQAARAEGEGKDEQEAGVAVYRRMMIEHLWPVVKAQERNQHEKAQFVRWGHRFFLGFLGCIPALGLLTYLLH